MMMDANAMHGCKIYVDLERRWSDVFVEPANGKTGFSVQFKKIVTRYKKAGYNMDILQQIACMIVNPYG